MKAYLLVLTLSSLTAWCAAECKNRIGHGVSPSDIEAIVNKHNEFRKLVSEGKVANLPAPQSALTPLKWDSFLAEEAQKIADGCIATHAPVLDRRFPPLNNSKTGNVGQNVAHSASARNTTGANWNGVFQMWFDEHKEYKYGDQSNVESTGHFTQMIWANSTLIGCGFTHYQGSDAHRPYEKLYVCNYGPPGNIRNIKPYVVKQ